MSAVDYAKWLGNTQTITDVIDPSHVARIAATFSEKAPVAGDELPALWHWAFFEDRLAQTELGTDGHPARGGFLPPADNRNRMWAGGRLEFLRPLVVGEKTQCTVSISKIEEKQGSTGSLLFVTLRYEYQQQAQLMLIEERNIVYREPSPPKLTQGTTAEPAQWSETVETNSVLLFRYSAVTFNGHRIHYDYPYVTAVEGYPNLVVHGPLIASKVLHSCLNALPGKKLKTYSYRGLRPQICPNSFAAQGVCLNAHQAQVWATNDTGLVQQGLVEFY